MDAQSDDAYWELRFGLALAVFAAALAINDLGAGKFGDDELKETNEKANSYMWYQAKSIKESLAEGQRDQVLTLLKTGAIAKDKVAEMTKYAEKLNLKVDRYHKEKTEILLGSSAVGEENWVQEIDGKLGLVVGSLEHEQAVKKLSRAGDIFDYATLCLELCMVLGAIGLLLQIPLARKLTFGTILVLGCFGVVFCTWAYSIMLL